MASLQWLRHEWQLIYLNSKVHCANFICLTLFSELKNWTSSCLSHPYFYIQISECSLLLFYTIVIASAEGSLTFESQQRNFNCLLFQQVEQSMHNYCFPCTNSCIFFFFFYYRNTIPPPEMGLFFSLALTGATFRSAILSSVSFWG